MQLRRDDVRGSPAQGALLGEHFQMGYATNDLTAARQLFDRQFGVSDFRRLEGPLAAGGYIRADFAWVGTLMYELIEASGPGSDIYTAPLPRDGAFHLVHHHLGFLVAQQSDFTAAIERAEANGWTVPYRNANALLEGCFVRVPGLSHLLEYLHPQQAGLDFFAAVPRH